MGDKRTPQRGPVGRMGDPWDEERMKLALQRIIQQITVHPIRRVNMSPPITPFLNSAHSLADWIVEMMVQRGTSVPWFEASAQISWIAGQEILFADPAD